MPATATPGRPIRTWTSQRRRQLAETTIGIAVIFGRRLLDLISGRDPRGGNVLTTLNPVMQQVAYDQLTAKGYTGSVVAL
ncbi:hypothetical protein, partial [Rhodococcus jostii]